MFDLQMTDILDEASPFGPDRVGPSSFGPPSELHGEQPISWRRHGAGIKLGWPGLGKNWGAEL